MNAIVCAAGFGGRIKDICKKHGVVSKCLLPIGGNTILELTIRELINIGVTRLVIVVGEHNLEEIRNFIFNHEEFVIGLTTLQDFRIKLVVQHQSFHGTTAAVISGMKEVEGPFLLVWSDMVFRFPHGFTAFPSPPHNIVFTTSVSHRQGARFDGIVCSGNRVMAFSPRAIEKPGPFLINTGVYFIKDVGTFITSVRRIVNLYEATHQDIELPIEMALHDMLSRGAIFTADSLEFFIDLGTEENYTYNVNSLFGAE